MFWADKTVADIRQKLSGKIKAGKTLIVRDEKTASGRVHVGAMRTVAIHALVAEVLTEQGISNRFRYEINDFDAFDTVPSYVPGSFSEHLGKPLCAIPSPDKSEKNYARFFGEQYLEVVRGIGITPDVYYSSEQYQKGLYNDAIRTALERADDIRTIYKKISGSEKEGEWLPIMMVCAKCGKIATTRPVSFDGEQVAYVCDSEMGGAVGCGHKGSGSPFDGNAKLPWKVEWGAKFKIFEVDIEGEGKDLATKGGARDVANSISRKVFGYEPPYDIPHEFFLIGGKKMSTSKGTGASAVEVSALMPRKIFRLALIGKEPKRAFDFDPEGSTLSLLYDRYDEIADKYWSHASDDDARLFELLHRGMAPEKMFLMRFSQVAFIIQMPHLDIKEEAARMKGEALTKEELLELGERAKYARSWLNERAEEKYIYQLHTDAVPEAAKALSKEQKEALAQIATYIEAHEKLTGEELHHALHEIKKKSGIAPKELFSSIYCAFLGRDSGPQAGWFLSVLDREFLLGRLKEVAN
jgi:lysyl-tRNA synthetase class 1